MIHNCTTVTLVAVSSEVQNNEDEQQQLISHNLTVDVFVVTMQLRKAHILILVGLLHAAHIASTYLHFSGE